MVLREGAEKLAVGALASGLANNDSCESLGVPVNLLRALAKILLREVIMKSS